MDRYSFPVRLFHPRLPAGLSRRFHPSRFIALQVNFFWMNVDKDFGQEHLADVQKAEEARKAATAAVENATGSRSPMMVDLVIDAKRAAVVKIGEALQPIAGRNMGEAQPVNAQGTWSVGATMFGESVRVSTPDEVLALITARASGMIWASCDHTRAEV